MVVFFILFFRRGIASFVNKMSTGLGDEEKKSAIEASSTRDASTVETIENESKANRKPTVLESHGYALGRTIGAGSYATVKVSRTFYFLVALKVIQGQMYTTS